MWISLFSLAKLFLIHFVEKTTRGIAPARHTAKTSYDILPEKNYYVLEISMVG